MRYKELKHIVDKRLNFPTVHIPQDSFKLATQLHLRVKNSVECLEDFKEKYPLTHCNAIYALCKGEYVIYFDEKYPYKNFAVAHEIAHHLLDYTSDGAKQHLDAQLMAAIIVAPADYIHNIKSAHELAERCKIPIDVAENYWYELEEAGEIEAFTGNIIISVPKDTIKATLRASILTAIAALTCLIGFKIGRNSKD